MFEIKKNTFYAMRMQLPDKPFKTHQPIPSLHSLYSDYPFGGNTILPEKFVKNIQKGLFRIILVLEVYTGNTIAFLTCTGDKGTGQLSKEYLQRYIPLPMSARIHSQPTADNSGVSKECTFGYVNFTTPLIGTAVKFECPPDKQAPKDSLPPSDVGAVANTQLIDNKGMDNYEVSDQFIAQLSTLNQLYQLEIRWNENGLPIKVEKSVISSENMDDEVVSHDECKHAIVMNIIKISHYRRNGAQVNERRM